jgi:hypothetical protein
MFKTEVDLESFSKKATARWKKQSLSSTTRQVNKSENKRLHSLILTNKPENFLNLSTTAPDSSGKVSKQEDLPEISAELHSLRKKHDINRGSNFLLDRNMTNLKKQMESFRLEELKTLNRLTSLKNEVERLENALEETVKRQEDAFEATKVYNHIIERMKIHRLKLDIKNEETIKTLKASRRVLDEEFEVRRKQKESKIKTKKALDSLEGFIDQETKDKEDSVCVIEKDMKKRLENSNKREDRYRRQIEIAERAANEDREARATQMREDVILMRFWFIYMRKRLDYDMNRLSYIEEAFEKVRKNSHINDTSEMVAKVLTTEIAFNDLRKIVEDSNYNILKTQEKIQEIEENLRKVEKMKNQSNLKESLQTEILEKLKTGVEDQNKLIKLKEVHQKIKVWSSKMIKKLGGSLKSPSLQENMSVIKDLLINNIESLKTSGKLSQVVEGQPVSLKQVIQSIENKDLKKIRSDSAERLLQDSEVMRELAYSTPSLDLKLKK